MAGIRGHADDLPVMIVIVLIILAIAWVQFTKLKAARLAHPTPTAVASPAVSP